MRFFIGQSSKLAQISIVLRALVLILFCVLAHSISNASEAPKFVEKDGRWALLVDGQPFLILGGQVHNSSAWPSDCSASPALHRS